MKIRIPLPRPRNPLVAACARRAAGSHRRSSGASRQAARRTLQREVTAGRNGP